MTCTVYGVACYQPLSDIDSDVQISVRRAWPSSTLRLGNKCFNGTKRIGVFRAAMKLLSNKFNDPVVYTFSFTCFDLLILRFVDRYETSSSIRNVII
jgi:hypothetical protein